MNLEKKVILLGEDIEDDAILFQLVMRRVGSGSRVVVLEEARDILNYLKGSGPFQNRATFPLPEMVFLDGQLHHEPSMGLLRWIVKDPSLKDIPIVILTGSLDPRVCAEAKRLGAIECFEKPFTEADLRKLEQLLEDKQQGQNRRPREVKSRKF
jgi:CheY-like chemotaxis protein